MRLSVICLSTLAILFTIDAHAQSAVRVPSCGTAAPAPGTNPLYIDSSGNLCVNTNATASGFVKVPLDVSVVTTSSTAVAAFAAGHTTKGGWIYNPAGSLCIDEIDNTSGVATQGNTTCIAANATYQITPGAGAVWVNATDAGHLFSGLGRN